MRPSKTKHISELNAVVFPPCGSCGVPYRPSKPILDYGTLIFKSEDTIANLLYSVECFIKKMRLARLRSL